jgi:hypothetical protein
MIFKVYNGKSVSQAYFKFCFYVNLLLIFISLIGLNSGSGITATFAGISFIAIVTIASMNERFRKNPLSSIFCFFTLIYLSIPCCFILAEGTDFLVGISVGKLPFDQIEYQDNRDLGFIYLTICWLSVWFGIYYINFNRSISLISTNLKIKLNAIILMTVLVAIITIVENDSFISVKINNSEHVTSLIAFLLMDHSFLILSGVLFLYKINKSSENLKNTQDTIGFIFVTFVVVGFIAGSKGALLVVFTLLILYPFFLSTQFDGVKIIFIRPIYLVFLAILAPILFYLGILKRLSFSQGTEFDLLQLFSLISEIQPEIFYDTISSIFYRLAWGGLDQFLLLFKSYLHASYDFNASNDFTIYLIKNTINLLLPGTPFQEAYAPSSQLFPSVLNKEYLFSEFDRTALIISLNTQPYTIFGVFMIIFGIYSPILLFVFTVLCSFIIKSSKNILIKVMIIYFFSGALSSYAFESVIGATFNVLISLFFMFFLMSIYSKLYFNKKTINLQ